MRTIVILLFLLLCLPGAKTVTAATYHRHERASSFQSSITIDVAKGDWGEAQIADIRNVLQFVAGELFGYFPNKHVNIQIIQGGPTPRAFCQKGPRGEYIVRLNVKNQLWAKFSYQFAHELFHVLSNHEVGCGDPGRSQNQWFEETLGEVSSMFILAQMATSWRQHPPIPGMSDYALAFDEYVKDLRSEPHRRLPNGTVFVEWFGQHHGSLRQNPYLREKEDLIANQLLPLFSKNPASWESVAYLNLGNPDASNSFQSYLDNWYRNVPTRHKAFVRYLAGTFGMRITGP